MKHWMGIVTMIGMLCLFINSAHAEPLGDYTSHEVTDSCLIIWAGEAAVIIAPAVNDIARISFHPDGNLTREPSQVVVPQEDNFPFTVQASENSLNFLMGSLAVHADFYPLRFQYSFNSLLMVADEDGLYTDGTAKGVRFTMQPMENFYGGGERAININRRGQRLDSYNQPHYCYGDETENLNITIPFVLSSDNWGVLFDGNYPGVFDFGATDPGVFDYQVEDGDFSYYLITGSDMRHVMQKYVTLTGKAPLPPLWALGYIQSRYGYESETQARSVVTTFRAMQIPLDALVLDLYWFGWGQMGDFDWDFNAFPTPQNMMADFSAQGVKTIVITEPYVVTTSENYGPAAAQELFCTNSEDEPYLLEDFWAGSASLLDITDENTRDWWWEFYEDRVNEGVGGWWSDLGEPEMHIGDMRHEAGFANAVHNTYSLQWAKLLYDGYQAHFPEQRVFNLIRSGYAGMQRYGTFPWSGDVQRTFSGLSAQLPIMLSMGLSGVGYMGSDLGGFSCGELDYELYTRWMQMGAFSPVMRAHGWGEITEPIYFPEPTRSIVTDYIKLRYQLLPYNYSLAWQNSRDGAPLVRPLFWEFDDPGLQDCDDEYMWGSSFLVAPVLESDATTRSVYLPEGVWIDYWTEQRYTGGLTIAADAPIERMPLFVRAGSIIPMTPPVQSTEYYDADTLTLHIYPDPSDLHTTSELFVDDGHSPAAMANEEFYQYEISNVFHSGYNSANFLRSGLGYSGSPDTVQIFCEFHRAAMQPDTVWVIRELMPTEFTPAATMEDYWATDSTYYYEEDEARLYVRFKWDGAPVELYLVGLGLLDGSPQPPTLPAKFNLLANYPNPFNAETTIRFELPHAEHVTLEVFDIQGRSVTKLLADARMSAGPHELNFNAEGLASGIYFYRLTTNADSQSKKMVLIK